LKPLIYLIRAGGIVEGRGKEEGFTGYMEIWSLLSSWVYRMPLYQQYFSYIVTVSFIVGGN
jgi:hypothetical protein